MIIGVTGGIASGKSAVCRYLRELGFIHIDADQTSREVLEMPDMIKMITEEFGDGILTSGEDGRPGIDRKKLGAIVFADPEKMEILEKIEHPRIIQEIHNIVTADPEKNYVIEAIAFYSSGLYKECDEIWVVHAEPEQQISRLMKSRNLTFREACDRLSSQKEHDWDEMTADHVICSKEPLESMYQQIRNLLKTCYD